MDKIKTGIIICARNNTCAGGKCFRAFQKHEGAFSIFKNKDEKIRLTYD